MKRRRFELVVFDSDVGGREEGSEREREVLW